MRPYVVSSSKATATGLIGGLAAITIDVPGGVRRGDVLYAFVSRAEDTGSLSFTADGWTGVLNLGSATGNDIRTSVARRVVTGSEPRSYVFTNGAGDTPINMVGIIVCVRGADLRSPEDVSANGTTGSNDFTPAATSVTPTSGHALILTAHGASMDSGVSGKTGGAPSGFTLIDYVEEATAAGFEAFLEVAWAEQTNPAASGTPSWTGTANDATSEFATMTLAIRPGNPMLPVGSLVPAVLGVLSAGITDTLLGADSAAYVANFTFITDSLITADVATRVLITGNPLEFMPVDNEADVPGWNLVVAQPLLWKPVDQQAHVPGWFLFVDDPLAEPMTADVFLLDDLINDPAFTLPLVTLDLETDGRAWDWQHVRSDPGAGSITVPMNDPDIGFLDTDDLLAVGFNMYGMRVFLMVIEEDDVVELSDDDEIGEAIRCTGRGTGVLLEEGDVDPSGGPYRSPVEEDRHFGWPADTFDHTPWAPVGVVGDVDHVLAVGAIVLFGFTQEAADALVEMQENTLRNLPTLTIPLLWTAGAGALNEPPGDAYFYEDSTMNAGLTIAAAGDYVFHFIADDEGEFYVDGQQVASIQGLNFMGTVSVAVTLSAGPHSVAAHVRNLDFGINTSNGAYFGWCLASESSMTTVLGQEDTVTVIAMSSGNAKILAYPPGVPGQAITKTIRLAVEESQARGFLQGVTLGFTDTTFSDGTPVLVLPDVATKPGTSVLGFLMELRETYIEWELDPVTLTLNVWAKDTTLTSPAVFTPVPEHSDPTLGNITSYRRKRERRKVQRLLIKWPGGWADAYGGSGGGEAPLELGSAQSLDEIERLTAGEFARFGDPRTQIDIGVAPEISDDAPYLGWRPMSRVLDDWGGNSEVVVSLTVATNDLNPEDPDITATLRDVILTPEQRQANDLRSLL